MNSRMQAFLLKGEEMKEPPKICRSCRYYQQLPFTEHQMYCMNPESEYAECESEDNDTCDSWESIEEN